jgi:DNA (cytosine-5)-methyltransferase 1
MLQVDELRKAMGFPQSHTFVHGTRRDRIKLLGNGVAPPVMKAILETLARL